MSFITTLSSFFRSLDSQSNHNGQESSPDPVEGSAETNQEFSGFLIPGTEGELHCAKGFISDQNDLSQNRSFAIIAEGQENNIYSDNIVKEAINSFETAAPEKDDEMTLLRIFGQLYENRTQNAAQNNPVSFITVLIHRRMLHFLSVGSCHIYLFRDGGLYSLKHDVITGHSLDRMLINGHLNPDEAVLESIKKKMVSYFGEKEDPVIDRSISAIPLISGDKIVLMSNHMPEVIPAAQMKQWLGLSPEKAAEAMRNKILSMQDGRKKDLAFLIYEVPHDLS